MPLPIKWMKYTHSKGLNRSSTGRHYPLRSTGRNDCSHQTRVWPAYLASNGLVGCRLSPWRRHKKRQWHASGSCRMTRWTSVWRPKPSKGEQALFQFYATGTDPSPWPALILSARPPPSDERSRGRWWTIAPACGVETPAIKPQWYCATVAMRAITRTARRNPKVRRSTADHGSVTPAKASSLYGGHRM